MSRLSSLGHAINWPTPRLLAAYMSMIIWLTLELLYSVFVNGRSRRVIMKDMEQRIRRGDTKQEKTDAIQVCLSLISKRHEAHNVTGNVRDSLRPGEEADYEELRVHDDLLSIVDMAYIAP